MLTLKTARMLPLALLMISCAPQADVTQTDELVIQGSDTEVQLVSSLAEAFGGTRPDASISVAGGGSAVGIAALINGETDIANSSRPMKDEEISKAKEKGRDPQEFIVARDGLSIVVHPSNPLTTISLAQLSDIYSGTVTNWKDLGGADAPISLYGRQSTSGTFGFFRDVAVKKDYATSMRQMEGTEAIMDGVKNDVNGVGYVGVGYVKEADGTSRTDVKILTVSKDGGAPVSPLDAKAVDEDRYPIARPIYQYLPQLPAAGSITEAFLKFEASAEGQAIVEKAGFYKANAADKAVNDAFFARIR